MSWIQTYSGKAFYPLAPAPDQVDVEDIAHSLSLLCRFNGHCTQFYSVAEHSVRVSHQVPQEHMLWALLHDAGEAYTSDLPRPIKQQLPSFEELEDKLLAVVLAKFKLSLPMPKEVKWADDLLLVTEKRDLMKPSPLPWGPEILPLKEIIKPLSSEKAKALFLDRFEELTK